MTERPSGPVFTRDVGELLDVNFPERTVEVVVVPYDTETVVLHRGRMIRESVAPGAFDGIERRANRIRANRDHDWTRLIGRALSFHPSHTKGLVAKLWISRSQLGEDTLKDADDGLLSASAGMRIMDGGETWPERNHHRLTRIWLDHIALTPDPAYPQAEVLAVRNAIEPAASGTPNLDEHRAWLAHRRLMALQSKPL